MNSSPTPIGPEASPELGDRELLRLCQKQPTPENFQLLLGRYLPFIYRLSFLWTGQEREARLMTRTISTLLQKKVRGCSRKMFLPRWLLQVSEVAARQLQKRRVIESLRNVPENVLDFQAIQPPSQAQLHPNLPQAPRLLRGLLRLKPKLAAPILLYELMGHSPAGAAAWLKTRESRAERRRQAGLKKVSRWLGRKRPRLKLTPEEVSGLLTNLIHTPLLPVGLAEAMTVSPQATPDPRVGILLDKTRAGLSWLGWKRGFRIAAACFAGFLGTLGVLALTIFILIQTDSLTPLFIKMAVRDEMKKNPGLALPARPWDGAGAALPMQARGDDLYQSTNIWRVHFQFSADNFESLEPERIRRMKLFNKDRTINLLNPNARRNGLAGVLGYQTDWVKGDFTIDGQDFPDVAIRYRGNGTLVNSLHREKRPFKIDLNKYVPKQKLAGIDTLNFNNLVEDSTYLHDALGYELFRRAGVPAPRTAFAWIDVSVEGKWMRHPLGLYALVENVDDDFAKDRFGTKKTALFKPVTYDLFKDLGSDWKAYERIYDLKTDAEEDAKKRVIEFAQFFKTASDEEFAERVAEFVDLTEFARFLSCVVLISSYDGFLSNGQNYYVYLDPKSNRFGFIPWDLDHAWGDFYHIGSAESREQASIWRPWSARHPFLERMMTVEQFRDVYRQELTRILDEVFLAPWLEERMMQIAATIDEAVQAESSFRHNRFQQAIQERWEEIPVRNGQGANRPVNPLRGFIFRRAASVRDQLEGRSEGQIMSRSH